jgi:holliday junction DNA helicase RuvA
MISHVSGTLVSKDLDRVEIMTAGGVAYELAIPLNVYESLPRAGEPASLHTHLVVKEDGWQLFGFSSAHERRVFQRVLDAKGVGPALALGLLSTLTADRLVRALRDKDLATLQSVPRVGRKKAEQLILDLADKLDDLHVSAPGGGGRLGGGVPGAEDAIRALVSLGYSTPDAERAVKAALDDGGKPGETADLVRRSLGKIRG